MELLCRAKLLTLLRPIVFVILGVLVGAAADYAVADHTSCEAQGGTWCSIPGLQCGLTWMGPQGKCCLQGTSCSFTGHSCLLGFIPLWGSTNCNGAVP